MNVRDDLKAFLDGELPLDRMDAVRRAVETDPALAREVEELRALSMQIRAAERPVPVEGLEQTLAALNRGRPFSFWAFAGGGLAAAAVVAGLIVVLLTRPRMDDSRSEVVMADHGATGPRGSFGQASAGDRARSKDPSTEISSKAAHAKDAASSPPNSSPLAPRTAPRALVPAPRVESFNALKVSRRAATSPPSLAKAAPSMVNGGPNAEAAPAPSSLSPRTAYTVPTRTAPGPTASPPPPAAGEPIQTVVVEVDTVDAAEARMRLLGIPFHDAESTQTRSWRGEVTIEVSAADAEGAIAALRAPVGPPVAPRTDFRRGSPGRAGSYGGFGGGGSFQPGSPPRVANGGGQAAPTANAKSQPANGQGGANPSTGAQGASAAATINQTPGSQALGNQTLGNQTAGNQTAGNQSEGSQVAANPSPPNHFATQRAGSLAADRRSGVNQSAGGRASGPPPAGRTGSVAAVGRSQVAPRSSAPERGQDAASLSSPPLRYGYRSGGLTGARGSTGILNSPSPGKLRIILRPHR